MVQPLRIPKLWGEEIWHHNDEQYCMKTLVLRQGFQCSLHYHPIKAETFLVVSGGVRFELSGTVTELWEGQAVDIEPGRPHRFSALTPTAIIVEASTFHSDEDVVRLEDSREL